MPDIAHVAGEALLRRDRLWVYLYEHEKMACLGVDLDAGEVLQSAERDVILQLLLLHIVSKRETVTCPGGQTRNFTSGFIGTREKGVYFPRFARFEMRAKLPHMNAMWKAH